MHKIGGRNTNLEAFECRVDSRSAGVGDVEEGDQEQEDGGEAADGHSNMLHFNANEAEWLDFMRQAIWNLCVGGRSRRVCTIPYMSVYRYRYVADGLWDPFRNIDIAIAYLQTGILI